MKTLSKSSQIPLYQQVVEWIRENIYSGDLVEDDRIPSEFQIMDMLDVSRGTVKKAVNQLVREGLLVQVQGKGTFVKKENLAYPLGEGLLSFAEALESQKINFSTSVITSRIEPANRHVAEKLGIKPGQDILFLERLRSIGDEKVMLIENRINIELCPGITEIDFTKENLFPTIERLSNNKIQYSESRYAARLIGNDRGHYLDISEDAPVLHLEQLVFFKRGSPVEFGNVWLKGNKYYLGTILQRRDVN
ncbi:GntR family transcriptional regulator [Enterobacteriaceae bacterium H11S18]|uniref:GntR family transcriptional regulator n=1 Tax=Dryocola clanedunensis TaxID=2925396 RepID=UPI0022F07BEF|nr:GntR family transcriptional regulator [Dryocola clanedunensis]MCT4705574.1 GntR family transcriptional regulator [Dryocola clanedunensis]MCT4711816.1 GntR family transcriptional regulator [Dryocola clanedunensis]